MSGRIPQQFIDDLIARTDIVELIDSRVPLKKTGRNYVARCPFHDEKSPSFSVSPDKQFFHCFGCGAHGTAIGFLMQYEHLEFIEAVEDLAKRAGVPIPTTHADQEHKLINPDAYDLLLKAANFYSKQLHNHATSTKARQYLHSRGLSDEAIARFSIGYSPEGWDNLLRAMGAPPAALAECGLAIKKDGGGFYDRFRDRIMFPIRDQRGRVIGFGGRTMSDETPKYLNSPESSVFHKGRELYGLFEARKQHHRLERLIVVEGYMDVVALSQAGITNAVGTLGTATTHEHLEKLFRATANIVFCFDGDRAGREAARKAFDNTLPHIKEGRQVRFCFIPDGEDPDTLVRQEGSEAFLKRIEDSIPLSAYFFESLTKQVDTQSIDSRARLVELARPLLSKLPKGAFLEMMLARLATLVRMDQTTLAGSMGLIDVLPQSSPSRQKVASLNVSPVRLAIALLLQQPALAYTARDLDRLKEMQMPGMALLNKLLEILQQEPHLNGGAVLERFRNTEDGQHLAKIAQRQLLIPDSGIEAEFLGAIECLHAMWLEQRTDQLLNKSQLGSLTSEEKRELQQLLTSPATKGVH